MSAVSSWWQDPQPDWTSGEPGRVARLLAMAYEDRDATRAIAETAGVSWEGAPAAGSSQDIWTWALTRASDGDRVLDIMAEVLHDPASDQFHTLLRSKLGDHLNATNARLWRRYGLPAPSDEHDAVLKNAVAEPTEPPDEPIDGLEALTSLRFGLENPRAYVQALLDAMDRTVVIRIGGHARGTGFLVGPQLVLTAAHVIDRERWPPDPIPHAEVVFDYSEVEGRSPEETGIRVPVLHFVTASLPTDGEVDGRVTDWNAGADRLDFALLELGYPAPAGPDNGRPRNSYQLDRSVYDVANSPLLFIIQHPFGLFQKLSFVPATPQRNRLGTRIRYRANTLAGSSGSPVVDIRGRLVAIHHYAENGRSQGVPLSAIAEMLLNGPHAALFSSSPGAGAAPVASPAATAPIADDPFETTSLMGLPFVNRENLREYIRGMAQTRSGAPRTLAISGELGSGVSYSYRLASHVAGQSKLCPDLLKVAPEGLIAFPIDLGNYISVEVERRRNQIAGDLLIGFRLRKPMEALAQDACNIHSLRTWLTAELSSSDKQWWVFVDSIDNLVSVQQGAVHELIHMLIDVANDPQVPLRVVLAGRMAKDFATEHAAGPQLDTAVGLLRGDVEDWFKKRGGEEGQAIDAQRLANVLSELFPAGGLPEPRTLAPQLPKRLLELLEPDDGS